MYGEAVSMDMFPSVWQRSIFNEPDLRAQPWWSSEETGYLPDIRRIEKAMGTITRLVHYYIHVCVRIRTFLLITLCMVKVVTHTLACRKISP